MSELVIIVMLIVIVYVAWLGWKVADALHMIHDHNHEMDAEEKEDERH